MTITLPFGFIWFIVIVMITAFLAIMLGTWASFSHERRQIRKAWLSINVSHGILQHRNEIHDRRHRILCQREEAVHELGRTTHDVATQVRLMHHQAAVDDTMPMMPVFEEEGQ